MSRLENLDESRVEEAAHCLKVLGHPQRLRIVDLVASERLTVGEIAERVGISANAACEHLRLLQVCRLLSSSREGKQVFYKIEEPHLIEILKCIQARFEEATNEK